MHTREQILQGLNEVIIPVLQELETLFSPDTKLSFIARLPGNEEADILISKDNPADLIALLERTQKREEEAATPKIILP